MCAKRNVDKLYKGFQLKGDISTWHHYEYGMFNIKIRGIYYWQHMARNLYTNNYVYVSTEKELFAIMDAAYIKFLNGPMPEKPYPDCVDKYNFKRNVNSLEQYNDKRHALHIDDRLNLYRGLLLFGTIMKWNHYEYGLHWIKIEGVLQWQHVARNIHTKAYIAVNSEDELFSIMDAAYATSKTGHLPTKPYPEDVNKKTFLQNIQTLEKGGI